MREIKFRAKSFDGEWVCGDLHLNCKFPLIYTQERRSIPIDPATVGQFTGLFDEDGREIYEGDIIKVREYENLLMKEFSDEPDRFDMFSLEEIRGELLKEYISPVVFCEGGFLITTIQGSYDMWLACLFGDMKRSSPSFDFEVIGNIHDNPELLEGGEQ